MIGQFYVYGLINPIDHQCFYVGKGSGKRFKRHVSVAKSNHISQQKNPYLYRKINKILNCGYNDIDYEFFGESLDEVEAYALEAAYIDYYKGSTCNISRGGLSDASNYLKGRKRMQSTKDKCRMSATRNVFAIQKSKDIRANKMGFNSWSEYQKNVELRTNLKFLDSIMADIKEDLINERIADNDIDYVIWNKQRRNKQ